MIFRQQPRKKIQSPHPQQPRKIILSPHPQQPRKIILSPHPGAFSRPTMWPIGRELEKLPGLPGSHAPHGNEKNEKNIEYRTRNRRMMKFSLRYSIFDIRHSTVHKSFYEIRGEGTELFSVVQLEMRNEYSFIHTMKRCENDLKK